MAVKISKRTREQAALICARAASTPYTEGLLDGLRCVRHRDFPTSDIGGWQRDPVFRLAASAFQRVITCNRKPRDGWPTWFEQMAEAALLLEEGWSPC